MNITIERAGKLQSHLLRELNEGAELITSKFVPSRPICPYYGTTLNEKSAQVSFPSGILIFIVIILAYWTRDYNLKLRRLIFLSRSLIIRRENISNHFNNHSYRQFKILLKINTILLYLKVGFNVNC